MLFVIFSIVLIRNKYDMMDKFTKLLSINPNKIKTHYAFEKRVWITEDRVYKFYRTINDDEHKRLLSRVTLFSELFPGEFEIKTDDTKIYIQMDLIPKDHCEYYEFLTELEFFLKQNLYYKKNYVYFEDLGRHNYFKNDNKIILIDESKIKSTNDFRIYLNRITHSLITGYKNEIRTAGLDSDSEYEIKIYQIVKSLENYILSNNFTKVG
jgi:hypothetical protein